jgi:ribosome-associated heat shock protein Hsp15
MSGADTGAATGAATDGQRLDKWLWCARFLKQRGDCARFVADGGVRVNRQPTDKPHARLRVGDVLTIAFPRAVRVIVVLALADRRGPPAEARALYREVPDGAPLDGGLPGSSDGTAATGPAGGCGGGRSVAYPRSIPPDVATDTRSA